MKPEVEQYKASKEYKQLLEEIKKRDDDDEFRNDTDPRGYELYEKFVSLTISLSDPFSWLIPSQKHYLSQPGLLSRIQSQQSCMQGSSLSTSKRVSTKTGLLISTL